MTNAMESDDWTSKQRAHMALKIPIIASSLLTTDLVDTLQNVMLSHADACTCRASPLGHV